MSTSILLIIAFYSIPLASLVLKSFKTYKINRILGLIEFTIGGIRNIVFGVVACILILKNFIHQTFYPNVDFNILPFLEPLFLLVIINFARRRKILICLKCAEFLRTHSKLHPKVFFDTVYQLFGPFECNLELLTQLNEVNPEKTSFKKNHRATQTYSILVKMLVDTTFLAHTSLKAYQYVGREFAREIFDVFASMWGKRSLELMNASLEVTGLENLENLEGRNLLIFNHKSQLDFILTFFTLSSITLKNGRGIRPRFITAKDHFVDNILVYSILGIGKLIETVDMVFIERRKKGQGFQNLKQAASFLARKDIDIAIYPQGTRAEGNVDRSNKRRDAGFYTTVAPRDIQDDYGHLRKGCAHLTVDTLLELSKSSNEKLNLIFIGLEGTATAMSKQSLKVQTETDIHYAIGKPLVLSTDLVKNVEPLLEAQAQNEKQKAYLNLVNTIHQQIDFHLVYVLKIHEKLANRFFLDLQGSLKMNQEMIDHVKSYLITISKESSVAFQILDRIYALDPEKWNPYLSELAQILMDNGSIIRFKRLRDEVTEHLLSVQKTRIHGKKINKEDLLNKAA